jgi:hypothetical protein
MNDIDIYNLATEVISSITNDMNESWYEPLGGELTVSWSTERKFNAWASSEYKSGGPPVHKVGMYYELARQLYKDIDDYCSYIESGLDQKNFDFWFKDDPAHCGLLPSGLSKEDYRKNMFLSGLTWVFFHEIGHLNQEHGVLRDTEQLSDVIHEADVHEHRKLEGRKSAIYHATELSADFEATSKTLMELIRHFNGEELESSVYLFVCGLSCVLYRFNGEEPFESEEAPKGSHPKPLIRLESVIPIIYETLDLAVRDIAGIKLDRRELVCMCSRASTTVGLYWLRAHAKTLGIPDNYFIEGVLNKPGVREYMARIIEVWDEIEPEVQNNKHYGHPLEVLRFTPTYRNLISGSCEVPDIPA